MLLALVAAAAAVAAKRKLRQGETIHRLVAFRAEEFSFRAVRSFHDSFCWPSCLSNLLVLVSLFLCISINPIHFSLCDILAGWLASGDVERYFFRSSGVEEEPQQQQQQQQLFFLTHVCKRSQDLREFVACIQA